MRITIGAPKRERDSALAAYLRTGRRPVARVGDVEVKFNPWHDPHEGRFKFEGQGVFYGRSGQSGRSSSGGGSTNRTTGSSSTQQPNAKPAPRSTKPPVPRRGDGTWGGGGFVGGGGGDFRGGGATGSGWSGPPKLLREQPPSTKPQIANPFARPTERTIAVQMRDRFRTISKNNYRYAVDASKRTRQIDADLVLVPYPRSRINQRKAGGPDRRTTDEGGHYIAARFNGPSDKFNHFAQDKNFNHGLYRSLEDRWARELRDGRKVVVEITPLYRGQSQRPYEITVKWAVDGKTRFSKFPNEAGRGDGR